MVSLAQNLFTVPAEPRENGSYTEMETITEVGSITDLVSPQQFTTFPASSSTTPTSVSVGIGYNQRIVVASVYVAIAIIGLPGYTLVIVSAILSKKLQTTTNILVVNLAIADFITCLCIPFHVLGLIKPSGEYLLPEVVCAAVAGIFFSCIVCSVETLVAIGFVRWYVITKSLRGHRGINSPCGLAFVVAICWVLSFLLICLPPLLGVGHLGYSHLRATCSVNPVPINLIMATVFTIGCLSTPIVLLRLHDNYSAFGKYKRVSEMESSCRY